MKQLLTGIVFLFSPLCLDAQSEKAVISENAPAQDTLSAAHSFLSVYEGTWTEEVSLFNHEGGEPEKFTLTTVINTILGGRFLQCTRTGELYAAPFEGLTTLGYNKSSGIFTVSQISTESTGTLVLEGRWKEPGTSIALQSIKGQSAENGYIQMTITFEDKDNIRIGQFETDDKGVFYKSREYYFSRQ
jgi:hypothetical protein